MHFESIYFSISYLLHAINAIPPFTALALCSKCGTALIPCSNYYILYVVFSLLLFPSTILLFAVGNDPFTFSASSTTVNEGDEVNITVTFRASPRPNVSLERQDGNAIPDEEDRVITTNVSNDMSQLTFQDLREQDTGNYSVLVDVSGDVRRQPIVLTVVCEFRSIVHCQNEVVRIILFIGV